MSLHESGEMYLETIYVLSQKKGSVRSIDVAEYMEFSKPSVSRAISVLKADGFVFADESGLLHLTEQGMEVATTMYTRHVALTDFLMKIGVSEQIAAQDACKMEHAISEETFAAVCAHIETL